MGRGPSRGLAAPPCGGRVRIAVALNRVGLVWLLLVVLFPIAVVVAKVVVVTVVEVVWAAAVGWASSRR